MIEDVLYKLLLIIIGIIFVLQAKLGRDFFSYFGWGDNNLYFGVYNIGKMFLKIIRSIWFVIGIVSIFLGIIGFIV